jgi:hypothetical protein
MIGHYDEIKGTKQKLYETAICKGYLTNYNRAWRHSFVGAFEREDDGKIYCGQQKDKSCRLKIFQRGIMMVRITSRI